MERSHTIAACSAAALLAMSFGDASAASAAKCAPAWVKQAFIMGNLMPCINEDLANVGTTATPPRLSARRQEASKRRLTRIARRRAVVRSRVAVSSGALRPALPIRRRAIKLAASKHKSTHWGYRSENGPAKWSALDDKFQLCGAGKQQSPIDISKSVGGNVTAVAFNYKSGPATVVNNGHTVQVNVARGNRLQIGDRVYRLVQFHFHTPSENTVNGLHYPMETHLVHADANGRLAVVALMVRAGRKGILDHLPQPSRSGEKVNAGTVDPSELLPASKHHFVFKGSLTTPPCSEGVDWFVMKQPIEADRATIARFYSILGANNRPTNPLNGRADKLAQ